MGSLEQRNLTVVDYFESHVDYDPGITALKNGNESLSYGALDRAANRSAHSILSQLGNSEETVVALFAPTLSLGIGLLATFKANETYVASEPTFPEPNLKRIILNSGTRLILTDEVHKDLAERLAIGGVSVLTVDDPESRWPDTRPARSILPESLAWVLHTTGSTGEPKGVIHSHRNLIHADMRFTEAIDLNSSDRILRPGSTMAFAGGLKSLVASLIHGCRFIFCTVEGMARPEEILLREEITIFHARPSIFRYLLDALSGKTTFSKLRAFCVAGEKLYRTDVERFREFFPSSCVLFNQLALTEAGTVCQLMIDEKMALDEVVLSIGYPTKDTEILILDEEGMPLKCGATGEIAIKSRHLALGYLGNEELTKKAFLYGTTEYPERIYLTGDLGRFVEDSGGGGRAQLFHLGRKDHRVMIRGYQVDIRQIEDELKSLEGIKEVVVSALSDGPTEPQLVAYLIPVKHFVTTSTRLRQELLGRIPDYMVPSAFMFLEAFPLTADGKVDRALLPAPESSRPDLDTPFAPPVTPTEIELAAIWEKVLGISGIGADDSFFELGGHSLLAMQVILRARDVFTVELNIREVFENATVAKLAHVVQSHQGREREDVLSPMAGISTDSKPCLSHAQKRLWFLDQLDPDRSAYNVSDSFRLVGSLDVVVLEKSINELVRRQAILRTSIRSEDGEPFQSIAKTLSVKIRIVDLHDLKDGEREKAAESRAKEEALCPFDLDKGPLFRVTLFRLGPQEYVMSWVAHHIISDAWSKGILWRQLTLLYRTLMRGETPSVPELPVQFADFAEWQNRSLQGEFLEKGLNFWRRELDGAPPLLELPTDRPRPAVQTYRGGRHPIKISESLTNALGELCRDGETSMFMTLLAAFQTLLSRYSGQDDIVVGSPVANRTRSEVEGLIGFFANTLALRTKFQEGDTFHALLGRVRNSALGAYAHQDIPFELLVNDLEIDRDLSRNPLFQAMFTFQNVSAPLLELSGLTVERLALDTDKALFDLTLTLKQADDCLVGYIEYSTDLFEDATIRRMAGHFQTLLQSIVIDPDQRIADLPLITEDERHQLLVEWNDTAADSPEMCVHELFEEQVEKSSDAIAVVCEGEQLTYRELNERSNQLAHHLKSLGVKPEMLVGLCLERSVNTIVGFLGILKAGGAYLPLDSSSPVDRLEFMLQDSGAAVVITSEKLLGCLPGFKGDLVCLDKESIRIAQQSIVTPVNQIGLSQMAYVIYTSGSTGIPKGVVVEHTALAGHVEEMSRYFELVSDDRVLQFSSLSFDASIEQIMVALTAGARLIVRGESVWSIDEYLGRVSEYGLTVCDLPTAYWQQLLASLDEGSVDRLGSLRLVIVGGEQMNFIDVQKWMDFRFEQIRLLNAYGPTETTITASCYEIPYGQTSNQPVSIGRAVSRRLMLVLDQNGGIAPIGIAGELYIGGAGLARGYLKRPELTAESFVANPFDDDPDSRLYRTGDLCRWRADGNLEFLGRLDDQVKLRGFRIELGEIELAINAHSSVSQNVVLLREDLPGDKSLVAYLVSTPGVEVETRRVREHLQEKLPDYMVPSIFVALDKLPLTPSGKVDRRALPAPDGVRPELESGYVAPRTNVEETLSEVWQELLGVDQVGIHDNFFELGGHSLVAIRVNARIASELQFNLSVRSLFEAPTIAGLAGKIEELRHRGDRKNSLPLIRVARDSDQGLPLSFSQQRLWFLEQLEGDLTAYNMSFAWRIKGDLDTEALRGALETVVSRHEVLRTTFEVLDGEPVQIIGEAARFELPVVDLSPLKTEEQELEISRIEREEASHVFDLGNDLMLQAFLLRLSENESVLLLIMHHIASDGWSLEVLRRELGKLYDANCRGEEAGLSPLAVQYADFAIWQRQSLAGGGRLDELLTYWRGQLSGLEALELPTDRTRPLVPSYRGARCEFEIPGKLIGQLEELGRIEGTTLQMTLLAAFQVLLSRYSGQDDIAVGTPIAGRNHADLEEQIGFFVNTLVLRADLSGEPTFRELLGQVREMSLGAYDHGDLPFEKLVEELQPKRDQGRSPLFQVLFQLLNFSDDDLLLENLEVSRENLGSERVRFDLEMHLRQQPEKLSGVILYSTDLFDLLRIERMVGHFLTLLEGIAAEPGQCIGELPILTKGEQHQLLVEWNDTAVDYPRGKCIHQIFEEQVDRTPEVTALVYQAVEWT